MGDSEADKKKKKNFQIWKMELGENLGSGRKKHIIRK